MSTQSVSNWWAQESNASPTLTRTASVTRSPSGSSVQSSVSATPSVSVSSGPSVLSANSVPSVPSGPQYTGQPKPVWVSNGVPPVEAVSEAQSNTTLLRILGGIVFLFLILLVGYVIYHWLWSKRVKKTTDDFQKQAEAHQAGIESAQSDLEEQAKACPEKSPYGDQFPVGTSDCSDTHPSCPAWAANDECWINPGYMLYKCRKSCQTCGLDPETLDKIRDSNLSRCQDWGDCSNAQCTNWYHALRCRKTCFTGGCYPKV